MICVCCSCYIINYAEAQTEEIIVLRDGWSISENGSTLFDQPVKDISDYTFACEEKGDILILSRKLSGISFEEARLVLDTWHSIVTVYLDEQAIYTHGREYEDAGKMLGNIRHYIDLPVGYQQETLYIEMIWAEDGAMSGITPIGIADNRDLSVYWFNRLFPLLIPAVILCSFGLLCILAGIVFKNSINNTGKLQCLGMLLLGVG